MLGIVLDFGISVVLTRAVARDPGATAERWATAATLKLLLLGLVGPVYLAVPLLMHRPWDTTAAVWLLGLAIVLQTFLENAVSVFTAVQRLEQEFQMRLLEKIVLVTVGFAALGLGVGLLGVAAAFALAAAVSLVFAVGASTAASRRSRDGGAPRGRGAWPGSWPRWPRRSSSASPPRAWRPSPSCS